MGDPDGWTCPTCGTTCAQADSFCIACGSSRASASTAPLVREVKIQRRSDSPEALVAAVTGAASGPGVHGAAPGQGAVRHPGLPAAPSPRRGRSGIFFAVALVAVLVLALAGFAGAKALTGGGDDATTGTGPNADAIGSGRTRPTAEPAPSNQRSDGGAGATSTSTSTPTLERKATTTTLAPVSNPRPLAPTSVTATCQSAPGVDAAGNRTTYEPAKATDGTSDTTWRCDGDAAGQSVTLDFGRRVHVAVVDFVPGFDKIDPSDGADRYLQNRRVTAATLVFDGSSVPVMVGAGRRQAQAVNVMTTRVTIRIDATAPGASVVNNRGETLGPINRTPISEIVVRGA